MQMLILQDIAGSIICKIKSFQIFGKKNTFYDFNAMKIQF